MKGLLLILCFFLVTYPEFFVECSTGVAWRIDKGQEVNRNSKPGFPNLNLDSGLAVRAMVKRLVNWTLSKPIKEHAVLQKLNWKGFNFGPWKTHRKGNIFHHRF